MGEYQRLRGADTRAGIAETDSRGPIIRVSTSSRLDSRGPQSPEVYHTLRAMEAIGCDAFIDVHGDEGIPTAFCAGMEGCSSWGARLRALQAAFVAAYSRANPDMQTTFGYDPDLPMSANPAIGVNAVCERFDCLSLTLEMPFKDNANNLCADGNTWQGPRAAALGASLLDALAHVSPALRGVDEPLFADAYVATTEDAERIDAFVEAAQRACEERRRAQESEREQAE